jgi:SCP-2 sterol transfer family
MIGVDVPDPAEEFFERLNHCGYEPRLMRFPGTIRFELDRDQAAEHWLVRIDQGGIQATREDAAADLTIKADRAAFNRVLSAGGGARDIMAAYVRQAIMVEGDPRMLYVLRIVGGAPSGRHPRSMVSTPRGDDGR